MRRGELEATSSRACTDVLLDLMYVVTSCVLFDVVRALRRPHRLQFEDH